MSIQPKEIRRDECGKYSFFTSMAEAETCIGQYFCLGEMPKESMMYYDNISYKILNHDNNNHTMNCLNLITQSKISIDSSENALYLGDNQY